MEEEELMAPLFKSSNQNIERFYNKQILIWYNWT